MATITGRISDDTLMRLRLFLTKTEGSTKGLGKFLDELINRELDVRENVEAEQGNAEAPCPA